MAGAFLAIAFAAGVQASHSVVQVSTSSDAPRTSEGVVEVHASPRAVYAALTDYGRWPELFSDVVSVDLKSGGRRDALLRFESRLLGHAHTVRLGNDENRQVDRKSTRLNSSHIQKSRMPSSA